MKTQLHGRDRHARYAERMRQKGYARAQLWVPAEELEFFGDLAAVARDEPLFWPEVRDRARRHVRFRRWVESPKD